jgi:aminopeptidase N
VADVCLLVAASPDREAVGLRDLARVATTDDQIGELSRRATSRDLRWRRLERLATLGRASRQDVDALERQDELPDAWLRAVRARAGLPDAAVKQETWQAVFDKQEIPAHSLSALGVRFWQPGQDTLLAPFAERFLEAVAAMQDTGLLWALSLTRGMFPYAGIDGDWLDRVDSLARSGALAPVVANALLERADRARRMWRARGGDPVSAR